MFTVKSVEIENFLCIKKAGIRIPDNTRWIFIAGDHGSGKTAFLKALAIGICGTKNAGHFLSRNNDCRISVELRIEDRILKHDVSWNDKIGNWSSVERPGSFCAYRSSRLDVDRSFDQLEIFDPEFGLLHQKGFPRNIEYWIMAEKHRGKTDSDARTRLDNVIRLLLNLLPNISEIHIENDNVYYREMGYRATIDEIASGHKIILATIGDMLIRLFEMQPREVKPENLEGIVVIDEIEVHMHPRHQAGFIKLLSEAFPKIQFICSTHGPFPLLNAPENSKIFVAERNEADGTTLREIETGMTPDSILTSPLFDFESLFNQSVENYAKIRTEDSYQEVLERNQLLDEIAKDAESDTIIPKEWLED